MASHRSLNVRETIDLNKDDSLTRFEMLAGISRLVRPSFWQWHDTRIRMHEILLSRLCSGTWGHNITCALTVVAGGVGISNRNRSQREPTRPRGVERVHGVF